METDGSTPWGDKLKPLKPGSLTLRFAFLNIGGFPLLPQLSKMKNFKRFVTKHSVDVVGLAEMNAHWTRLGPHQQIGELTRGWREFTPRTSLGFFKDSPSLGKHVFGGTALMSFHTVRDRSREVGCDPRGFGRWAWTRFHGRQGFSIRMVSCYRPVYNPRFAGSVWSQQRTSLDLADVDSDPRDLFFTDLHSAITEWLATGDQLVIGIDANDNVTSATLRRTFRNMGLQEAILHRHGPDAPPTSLTGSVPIDGLYVTPNLLDCRCGYTPMGSFDHRALWIDIPYVVAFGYDAEQSAPCKARRLRLDDPRIIAKYHASLRGRMLELDLFNRAQQLQQDTHPGYALTPEQSKEYDTIKLQHLDATQDAEKSCRKLHLGAVPFSPAYSRIRYRIAYWKAMKTFYKGNRVSRRLLARLAKRAGVPHDLSLHSEATCGLELRTAYALNSRMKKLHYELALAKRENFISDLAKAREDAGLGPAASFLRRFHQTEKQRRDARAIRAAHGTSRSGAVSEVIGPPFVDGNAHPDEDWQVYSSKEDIEAACLWENCRRFNQAHTTPAMTEPLFSSLGVDGMTAFGQSVLDGTFTPPPGSDEWAVKLLRQLQYIPDVAAGRRLDTGLSTEKYCQAWKSAKEKTAPGPSGYHFGHFKANTLPEAMDLAAFDTTMASICYDTGHSPRLWQQGLNCMLEKKKGNFRVDKLRAILLYEADFNMLQKILGRDCMFLAEELQAVAKEQYGCRKEHSAVNQGLNKTLTFDLLRQSRQPGALCSNDAKSCFDRIVHSIASLSLQRVGVPRAPLVCIFTTIRNLEHRIRTVYGDSDIGFSGRLWTTPIQGVGQGNGAGPQIWALVSTPVLNMLRQEGHGARFFEALCPDKSVHFVGYSFVDDTDLIVSRPGSSAMETASQMQSALDAWEGGIRGTGGAIVPEKSFWYLVSFAWKAGVWSYNTISASPFELTVKDLHGERRTLRRLEFHEAERTLGVFLAPDGNMKTQHRHLREKCERWADQIRTGHLPKRLAWQDYTTTISRSLTYPLAATTLTHDECRNIMAPVRQATLPTIGIVRTIANPVAYGPTSCLGAGLSDLWIEQGIAHVARLVGLAHSSDDVTGSLLRTSYQHLTLELGSGTLPLGLPFDTWRPLATSCWFTSTWEFLAHFDLTVVLPSLPLRKRRAHDQFLNEMVSLRPLAERRAFNRCRLFKQVVTLADLVTGDGGSLTRWAMSPDPPLASNWPHKAFHWPQQGRPSRADWVIWQRCLSGFLTRGRCVPTLGSWCSTADAPDKWFLSPSEQALYEKTSIGWLRYPSTIRRKSRSAQLLFARQGASPIQAIPQDAEPTDAITSSHYIRVFGSAPCRSAFAPTTFLAYLHTRDEHCQWALHELDLANLPLLLSRARSGIEILAISDGSFKAERSTAAWILQEPGSPGTQVSGCCLIPGSPESHDAYRGELGGLYGILAFLHHLQSYFALDNLSFCISCDGDGALAMASRPTQRIQPDSAQYDLIGACRNLRFASTLSLSFVEVCGHADTKFIGPLSESEHINTLCDRRAKAFRRKHAATPPGPLEIWREPARVYAKGHKIHCHLRSSLIEATSAEVTRDYWRDKQVFAGPTSGVAWDCLATASSKVAFDRRIYALKQAAYRLPTGMEMLRRKARQSATCPACTEPFENHHHILTCPARTTTWQHSLKKLKTWLLPKTSPSTTTQIILRLQHWHDSTTPPTLPRTLPRLFARAILAQDILGWDAFLFGFIAVEWKQAQRQYLTQLRSLANPKTLLAALIQKLWDVTWDQWQDRNGKLHHRDTGIRQQQLRATILELKQTKLTLPPQDRALLRTPLQTLLKSKLDYQETWCRRVKAALLRISRHEARSRDALASQRAFMSAYFRR